MIQFEDQDVDALLDVNRLTVELPTPRGWVRPVNDVSLRIAAGETLGLVGESGSGKTMLSLALMGLLPVGARVSGEAWQGGESTAARKNLAALRENEWHAVRGGEIGMEALDHGKSILGQAAKDKTSPELALPLRTAQAPEWKPGLSLGEMERELFAMTLASTHGNRARAAELLGVSLRTVRNKVREFGLPPHTDYRQAMTQQTLAQRVLLGKLSSQKHGNQDHGNQEHPCPSQSQ